MSGEELRAALARAVEWIEAADEAGAGHSYCASEKWSDVSGVECDCGFDEMLDALRAALAAPSTPEPSALDAAYRERGAIAAVLIRTNGWPAWVAPAPDADGWVIAYAETPEGQVSWHYGPDDFDLIEFLEPKPIRPWDGHTTEEKYERLAALTGPGYGAAPSTPEPSGLREAAAFVDRARNEGQASEEWWQGGHAVISWLRGGAAPSTPEPSGPAWSVVGLLRSIVASGERLTTADVDRIEATLRAAPSTEPALDANAMADALHFTAVRNHNVGEGPMRAICHSAESHRARAAAILARLAESQSTEETR